MSAKQMRTWVGSVCVALSASILLAACGRDSGNRRLDPIETDVIEVEVLVEVPVYAPSEGGAGGAGEEDQLPTLDEPSECWLQEDAGLWWEIKSEIPGHLRNGEASYSWFMGDYVEKFYEGTPDKGECSAINCDTQSYLQAVNAMFLCEYSDWRLPTPEELLSLPDLGMRGDEFSTDEPFYWTSSFSEEDAGVAQGVYLCCGGIEAPAVKTGAGRVLLVRDDVPVLD